MRAILAGKKTKTIGRFAGSKQVATVRPIWYRVPSRQPKIQWGLAFDMADASFFFYANHISYPSVEKEERRKDKTKDILVHYVCTKCAQDKYLKSISYSLLNLCINDSYYSHITLSQSLIYTVTT